MEGVKFMTCNAVVLHENYKNKKGFEGYMLSIKNEVIQKPSGKLMIHFLSYFFFLIDIPW